MTASADSSERPRGGRRIVRSIGRAVAILIVAALVSPLLVIGSLRWIDPPTSAFMIRSAFERRFGAAAAPADIDYRWTDLEDIAPSMALAVVAAEDQLFPSHHGFDLESISDAMAERGRRQRPRGASTLTQQVAKNLFLWPGRSWLRKGIEAYLAAAIELLWPKRRILEIYLNVAEMGPGLYGVGAAAAVHFGKPPAKLTRRESALLAAALPNPTRRHPDRPSQWLSERARWIEAQMDQLGGAAYLADVLPAAVR